MREKINTDEIAQNFGKKNCAQVIFTRYAKDMSLSEQSALNLGCGLGGGLREGLVCDSYLAGVLVLSMVFGGEREKFEANLAKFKESYFKRRNSKICKELLGYDLSKPNDLEIIVQKGLFSSICPHIVKDCVEILDEIIK